MGLKIDLYGNDGSQLKVIPPDIYERGVGGAELAMMTWAETTAKRGHTVRVYNEPRIAGMYDGVEYLPQRAFNPMEDRDVFIIYRSPNPFVQTAKAGIKIHWSTDQYTIGNFATDIFPFVDKVVCISPFHVNYHKQRYGVENGKIGYFDLGVRVEDYDQEIEKIPGRCIFCSVPDRGLDVLHALWPQIKSEVPEASLIITADYRLWGVPNPGNYQHRMKWLHHQDVIFLGKILREQLIKEQLAAQVHSYPCTYEELFCISSAECQVAGAKSVTTSTGALITTNKFGTIAGGDIENPLWARFFVEAVIQAMKEGDEQRQRCQQAARKRFDWQQICGAWERLFETGEFEEGVNQIDYGDLMPTNVKRN